MKFDGLFIFLFLSHPKTKNYEGLFNFLPLSNSKIVNLNGFHLFLFLSNSKRMKLDGIFIFLPLLDSKTMNLIMIFLSFVFVKFYNHEFKVFSYFLSLLNFEILNLDKFSYIWPLSYFRTLNSY